MKVVGVQATCHNIPTHPPLLAEAVYRPLVLVRVQTDEGITGVGMTGGFLRTATREFINRELGPFLRGRDPLETERLGHEMYWRFNQRALSGVVSFGISAVDIALWDIKGKYLGQPVFRLLGGYSNRAPAYRTFGLLEYSSEELVAAARLLVGQGDDKLKVVVAIDDARNVAEDAARVAAVREAVGPAVELMVDANHLFDFPHARELARRLEPYNIAWFEEPVYANDVRLLAELRRCTAIPIAAGQHEGHRWRHRDLIVGGAVDIVQPNVAYVGGFSEGLKVAHLAQAFNLPVATGGGWPHINAHLIAAVLNGWRVEYHLPMQLAGEAIFVDPPAAVDGWVTLPERPGLGLEPNEAALQEYLEP